jgi:hypothetical protein
MHAVIITHLGLGDGIIQSGLAVALLERYESVAFPAYAEYVPSLRSIFAYHPRIEVYPVPRLKFEDYGSPREWTYEKAISAAGLGEFEKLKLGVYSGRGIGWDFSKSFYEHAGVPYSMRWKASPIAKAWQNIEQIEPELGTNGALKVFLHDDLSRGFRIQHHILRGIQPFKPERDHDQSILRYAKYLIEADQIHCIDSAFFWLADSLPTQGQLFLHRYPRWQRPRDFRYETYRHWNYID